MKEIKVKLQQLNSKQISNIALTISWYYTRRFMTDGLCLRSGLSGSVVRKNPIDVKTSVFLYREPWSRVLVHCHPCPTSLMLPLILNLACNSLLLVLMFQGTSSVETPEITNLMSVLCYLCSCKESLQVRCCVIFHNVPLLIIQPGRLPPCQMSATTTDYPTAWLCEA